MGKTKQITQAEIDDIYRTADILMLEDKWAVLDDLLEYYGISAWRRDCEFLLSWATVTNLTRGKLKKRRFFMEQCIKFHSDPNEPDLWKSLWEDDTDPMLGLEKQ